MHKLSLLVLAAALLSPQAALAVSCSSKHLDQVVMMYKIYLLSGKAPQSRTINTLNVNNTVKLEGEVMGLMNYEPCWKNKPPCDEQADYQIASLDVVTSFTEMARNYGGNYNIALQECFMKLGSSGTYKAKNKP